jgi:hypothetical protein
MVDMPPVQLKRTPFHGSSITNHGPRQTDSPPFRFTIGDLFRWDVIFLVWLQKMTSSGTRYLNAPNLPFSDQNLNSAGRKMYVNGRYWETKVRGAGGVARSKGKEHLFWGLDSGILSSVNVGFLYRSLISLFVLPRPCYTVAHTVIYPRHHTNKYAGRMPPHS